MLQVERCLDTPEHGLDRRLVQNLRFTVERPTRDVILIRDHDNPSRNDWSVNYSTPFLGVTKDYALVLRVSDPKTDQMVVTVAGISAFGTLDAGEFLTNSNEIRKIEAIAPKGWKKKNLEMVLSVDVIRGSPVTRTSLPRISGRNECAPIVWGIAVVSARETVSLQSSLYSMPCTYFVFFATRSSA